MKWLSRLALVVGVLVATVFAGALAAGVGSSAPTSSHDTVLSRAEMDGIVGGGTIIQDKSCKSGGACSATTCSKHTDATGCPKNGEQAVGNCSKKGTAGTYALCQDNSGDVCETIDNATCGNYSWYLSTDCSGSAYSTENRAAPSTCAC